MSNPIFLRSSIIFGPEEVNNSLPTFILQRLGSNLLASSMASFLSRSKATIILDFTITLCPSFQRRRIILVSKLRRHLLEKKLTKKYQGLETSQKRTNLERLLVC